MKRPTIALLSLLSMLTLGLVAAGPRSCHAGSLGQLAFAIQVEETSTGDPMVCPLAGCPFAEQRDRCEELLNEEEAAIELNAAESIAESPQVAEEDNTPLDYQHYYEDYGYEYSDEYSDDYDPYADQDEVAEVTADDVTDAIVTEIDLNAAESSVEKVTDNSQDAYYYDEYYGEYAEEYDYDYDYGYEYDYYSEAQEEEVTEVTADDVAADIDVDVVEATIDDEVADGSQDAYYDEYYSEYSDDYDYEYEYEYDYSYDDTEYGYEYDTSETVDEVEPVATHTECNDDACHRVCFPPTDAVETKASSQISDADLVIAEPATYSDEYYEIYYEQFDAAEVVADASETDDADSAQWYEDDYEKYYSQEYYDDLEAPVATDDEVADEWGVDQKEVAENDDAEYNADAVYEDAVYGPRFYEDDFYRDARYDCPCPPTVPQEEVVVDGSIQGAYLAGNCIDESNAHSIDDLPWADEVAEADVAEIDVPVAGEASEYGSDYAEEFFDEQDDAVEAELPLEIEATSCDTHLPIVAAKTLHSKFDVSRLAARCGSQVAAWTETLGGLGTAVRTAYADLESGIETR